MKSQHQVILSIEVIKADRLENVKHCIELIHQEIGTVIKVSKIYETLLGVLKVNHIVPLHTFSSATKF
jgi:hypothetical protein